MLLSYLLSLRSSCCLLRSHFCSFAVLSLHVALKIYFYSKILQCDKIWPISIISAKYIALRQSEATKLHKYESRITDIIIEGLWSRILWYIQLTLLTKIIQLCFSIHNSCNPLNHQKQNIGCYPPVFLRIWQVPFHYENFCVFNT